MQGYVKVEEHKWVSPADMQVEIVERKGLGHPDYISDAAAEAASRALSEYYVSRFGRVLHHNVDKVLLIGGQANVSFGGGEIVEPIRIIVAGRATTEVTGKEGLTLIPYGRLIVKSIKDWIRENFRFLDPDTHVIVEYRVGRGSVDLRGIFEAGESVPLANDTSVGIGYAPMTTLEKAVLSAERFLNSRHFKTRYPAIGEDVKVMGTRRGSEIHLTIAAAIISSQVYSPKEYINLKEEVKAQVVEHVSSSVAEGFRVKVDVNTGDRPREGVFYLTVTGTSAEHGDDGMTGRGNRANGLITPLRPMSLEATAGKNPVSHVGKLYNVMAKDMAEAIVETVEGVREAYVLIQSQIGKPINRPHIVNVKLVMRKGYGVDRKATESVENIVEGKLERFKEYTEEILKGSKNLF